MKRKEEGARRGGGGRRACIVGGGDNVFGRLEGEFVGGLEDRVVVVAIVMAMVVMDRVTV